MIDSGKGRRRAALAVSCLLFLAAAGVTGFESFPRTVKVTLLKREYAGQPPEVRMVRGVSPLATVGEAVEAANVMEGEEYSGGEGMDDPVWKRGEVVLTKKVECAVELAGGKRRFASDAQTVGEALEAAGIETGFGDSVTPKRSEELTDETSKISVVLVDSRTETREERIPFETVRTQDAGIPDGQSEVEVAGVDGRKVVTEEVVSMDGRVTGRRVLSEETVVEPVSQVERVGTGQRTPTVGLPSGTASGPASGPSSGESSSGTSSGGGGASVLMSNGGRTRAPRSLAAGSGYVDTDSGTEWDLSDDDFDLVCSIVEHESGGTYEAALAVMTCVMNRVEADGYGDDPVEVLTASGQFESYFAGYYEKFTGGRFSQETRQAVTDCLAGKRSHSYLNFRGYQTSNSVNIGGNWFF